VGNFHLLRERVRAMLIDDLVRWSIHLNDLADRSRDIAENANSEMKNYARRNRDVVTERIDIV
jgi:hypothetical protein